MPENRPSAGVPGIETGYLFAGLTLLIWSGFVIVSRMGGQGTLTPWDIGALRIGTAALVLAPWWLPRLLKPELRQLGLKRASLFALLAGIAYPLVAYAGFVHAPASHGAVLISGMLPLFVSLFAFLLLGERPSRVRAAGLVFIVAGVATLFSANLHGAASPDSLPGDLLFISASILWALFTVMLKRWQVRAFDVTLAVVAMSAIIYLPVYALFLPKHIGMAPAGEIALQAFFQGFLVVCVAMWTYARATELLGAVKVAVMMSTVPVVGTLLSVPLLGEDLGSGAALGVVIVFLGALLGALAKSPAAATGQR